MLFLLLACGEKITNFDHYHVEELPEKFSRVICKNLSEDSDGEFEKLDTFPPTEKSYLYRLDNSETVVGSQCKLPSNTEDTASQTLEGLQLLTQESKELIISQLSKWENGVMIRFPILRVQYKDIEKDKPYKNRPPEPAFNAMIEIFNDIRADFMKDPQNDALKKLLQDAHKELKAAQKFIQDDIATVSDSNENDEAEENQDKKKKVKEKDTSTNQNTNKPNGYDETTLGTITDLLDFITVLNRWETQPANHTSLSINENLAFSQVPAQNHITLVQNSDSTYFLEYSHSDVYVQNTTVDSADLIECMNDCHCPSADLKQLNESMVSFQFAQNYCFYMDMRLPTESELWSIVHDTELKGGLTHAEWTSSPFSMTDWTTQIPQTNVDGSPVLVSRVDDSEKPYIHGDRLKSDATSLAKFRCVQDKKPTSFPKALSQPLDTQWNAHYSDTSFASKDKDYRAELEAFGARLRDPKKTLDITTFSYSYKDIGMVEEVLWAYHKAYPEVTQIYHLGYSRDKRPLLAIRVTDNPSTDEDLEPAILINGAHHGDEQLSVLYALKDLDTILKNYQSFKEKSQDPDNKNKQIPSPLLHDFDFWFIPLVNPDGNWQTLRQNKRYNVGRKNGRNTDGQCEQFPNMIDTYKEGVDLNRNYPFCWGCLGESGSKSKKDSYYYRGEQAASEPESQAMIALANRYHFIAGISWHTNGTMIISPYTIDGNRSPLAKNITDIVDEEVKLSPNIAWKLAENMVVSSPVWSTKRAKAKPLTVKSSMYPVDGTDQDWHFHEHGTLAYIIEGSHHNPVSLSTRRKSVGYIAPLMPTMLVNLQQSPAIHGQIIDKDGNPLEATVMVREHRFYEKENWTSRPSDGYFYRLVMQPGTYNIVVKKKGYLTVTKKVRLSAKSKQKSVTIKMLKVPETKPSEQQR